MRYFVGYLGRDKKLDEYYRKITTDLSERFEIKNPSLKNYPHMTLKAPFESNNIEIFEKILSEVASKQKSFKLPIVEFGYAKKTIFLKPTHRPEVQKIVDRIANDISEFGDNKLSVAIPIKLHISLARHLHEELSLKIQEYMNTLPLPDFELDFDNLTIFVYQENVWKIHKTFDFKYAQ